MKKLLLFLFLTGFFQSFGAAKPLDYNEYANIDDLENAITRGDFKAVKSHITTPNLNLFEAQAIAKKHNRFEIANFIEFWRKYISHYNRDLDNGFKNYQLATKENLIKQEINKQFIPELAEIIMSYSKEEPTFEKWFKVIYRDTKLIKRYDDDFGINAAGSQKVVISK